jgi:hypothetical protein
MTLMKRLTLAFVAAIAAAALVVAVPVSADPTNGHGAVITRTGGCTFEVDAISIAMTHKVRVETPSGNKMLVCLITPANITRGAGPYFDAGFDCIVNGVLTDDSLITVNARGNGVMHCLVHGNS